MSRIADSPCENHTHSRGTGLIQIVGGRHPPPASRSVAAKSEMAMVPRPGRTYTRDCSIDRRARRCHHPQTDALHRLDNWRLASVVCSSLSSLTLVADDKLVATMEMGCYDSGHTSRVRI